MTEFLSFIDLVGMLLGSSRTLTLFALLVAAAIIDQRTLRIPNWLTLGGTAFALIHSAFVPFYPGQGFLWALGGAAIGFISLLPLYAMRAMGAGDVKLMAMAGAFLGSADIIAAILASFIVGGVVALGFTIWRKALWRLLLNLKNPVGLLMQTAATATAVPGTADSGKSIGKLPFGVSICVGTIGCVVAKQLGVF